MRQLEIAGLQDLLATPKKIAITTHHKPDGDAIGSSLGLYHFLVQKGHQVKVVIPNEFPDFLSWLPGQEGVIDFEKTPDLAIDAFAKADLLFCLDFNTESRVEAMETVLKQVSCAKVLIDHHLNPQDFCQFVFSYPDACATCELIYDFIVSLGKKEDIGAETATCLYTGIMTDTGSFRFASTTSDVHRKIADLIDAGAVNYQIHQKVFDSSSESRLRLLGYALNNKLVVLPEQRVAYISLTREEMNRFQHQTGDTEGLVNYALSIKGIQMAAFFAERRDLVKISFRSKGDFSVQAFSEKHFEGGGHRNASGGKSTLTIEETIRKFESILPEYANQLTNN